MGWMARIALVLAAGLAGAALGVALGVASVDPGDGLAGVGAVALGLAGGFVAGLAAGGLVAWRGSEGVRRGALWMLGPVALAVLVAFGWRVTAYAPPEAPAPAQPGPATAPAG